LRRSITVTSSEAAPNALAAYKPANPPPTITTLPIASILASQEQNPPEGESGGRETQTLT
jgi:hypothetical protein